jgi:hypothetical protein
MMTPAASRAFTSHRTATPLSLNKEISMGACLSSPPFKSISEKGHKENRPPSEKDEKAEAEAEQKEKEEQSSAVAPLGKLATRMKSMLRRKTSSEKKSGGESRAERRRRKYQDLDYMEDVHWTEM